MLKVYRDTRLNYLSRADSLLTAVSCHEPTNLLLLEAAIRSERY